MAAKKKELPRFIPPMLAKPGAAFDSDAHLFEIKWDGTRTLAFIDKDGYRLVNRRQIDMTERYPEFAFLKDLPAGTVLDGEMVVLKAGQPDFTLLLSREQARTPLKVRSLAQAMPATYMVFDLLYKDFRSLLDETLSVRRQKLQLLLQAAGQGRLVLSDGVVGPGVAFYQEACRRGLEGVIAKRLESRYLPGKRTDAWTKIKRTGEMLCAIIGFVQSEDGSRDFRSLILATEEDGQLRYAGKVGTGFNTALRARLNRLFWSSLREKPLVPCKIRGKWVEPGLYCRVSYMERTANGEFRAPVFEELCENKDGGTPNVQDR